MKPGIILTTINARYVHPSFGLRYLLANMGDLRERTQLLEFDLRQSPEEVADKILSESPRIIGIGVYIWNVKRVEALVAKIKQKRPETIVVLGGPEVSHEPEKQTVSDKADYIIQGEADLAFAELCGTLLADEEPSGRIIAAAEPDLSEIELPYDLYTTDDLSHKLTYVEASRGCPFRCEYCLSSLDDKVRQFPLEKIFTAFESLLDRGATRFKFADRTFNLDIDVAVHVMEFFLDNLRPGLCVHFEMMPSNFPETLRECLKRFPADSLRLEIGVQTFNEEVSTRVGRRQDNGEVEDVFSFLRDETNALVHADLIAGLPGEDLQGFAEGFDKLVTLRPREIQVGILKRLHGTAIARHDSESEMIYDPEPPYALLHNKLISAKDMQRMNRFARYWEMIANSGRFPCAMDLLLNGAPPFETFMNLSDYLYDQFSATHGIPLESLAECIWRHLVDNCGHSQEAAAQTLWQDYGQSHNDRLSLRLSISTPQ